MIRAIDKAEYLVTELAGGRHYFVTCANAETTASAGSKVQAQREGTSPKFWRVATRRGVRLRDVKWPAESQSGNA